MNTFAVRGGKPVVNIPGPHLIRPPKSREDERDALQVIRDQSLTSVHQQSLHNQFQELFLDSLDNAMKYSVITPGFIESIWSLCKILDIGEGDEVVCSPFADYSLYDAVERTGAKIKIHDCNKKTGKVTPQHILDQINEHTKIVFVTHHRGLIQDVRVIRKSLASMKHITPLVVEDCSYAHGGKFGKDKVGTVGDVAIFPLSYEKLVFTGQGALIATNNRLVIDCIKQLFHHNFQSHNAQMPNELGERYRLSPLHATMGKYALRQFLYFSRGAEKCLSYFRERMKTVGYCDFIGNGKNQASWYGYVLQYDVEKLRKLPLKGLVTLLDAEGVELRTSEDSVIECLSDKGLCKNHHAYAISKSLLYLPAFYDWYEHKDIIDQYIAAFRKVQLNLFC